MTDTDVIALVTLADGGEPVTDTARIAEGVSYDHRNVLRLVKRHSDNLERFGGVRFQWQPFSTSGGEQRREVAILTEHQAALLLALLKNNPRVVQFKVELVRQFFAMRQQLREAARSVQPLDVNRALSDPGTLRTLLLAQLDRADAAEALATAAAPAVEFHAAVSASTNLQPIASVAKALNTGEIRLFRWLREQRILLPTNIPYQQHIDAGRFRVVERVWRDANKEPRATPQTLVTGKGVAYLTKRWLEAQAEESFSAKEAP